MSYVRLTGIRVVISVITYNFNVIVNTAGVRSCYDSSTSFRVNGSFALVSSAANSHRVNASYVTVRGAIVVQNTAVARREHVYRALAVSTLNTSG